MRDQDRKSIMYEETTRIRDNITGEVTDKDINKRVIKVPRTPDFLMLFTKHITYLEQLGKTDNSVLFVILSHYVGQKNLVFLSPQVRKKISAELELDISSVNKAIKNLLIKEVIVTDTDSFMYLNPFLFGKGNFDEIKKLRQELIFEYDFATNTTNMIRNVKAQYVDQEELERPHELVDATETVTDTEVEQTIYIQEVDPIDQGEDTQPVLPFFTEPELQPMSIKEDTNLEVIREQNRNLELKIQLAEIELRLKQG